MRRRRPTGDLGQILPLVLVMVALAQQTPVVVEVAEATFLKVMVVLVDQVSSLSDTLLDICTQ